MGESLQDQLTRKMLETVRAEIPNLVESALIQAQNIGFAKVQEVVRQLPIPPANQDQIVAVIENAKVDAPPPTVTIQAPSSAPIKVDATWRGVRTFVQALAAVVLVAFGDSILSALRGDGFDITQWTSWSNALTAAVVATVAAAVAFAMRYLTTRGT